MSPAVFKPWCVDERHVAALVDEVVSGALGRLRRLVVIHIQLRGLQALPLRGGKEAGGNGHLEVAPAGVQRTPSEEIDRSVDEGRFSGSSLAQHQHIDTGAISVPARSEAWSYRGSVLVCFLSWHWHWVARSVRPNLPVFEPGRLLVTCK
jgi:hypothetical protein